MINLHLPGLNPRHRRKCRDRRLNYGTGREYQLYRRGIGLSPYLNLGKLKMPK